MGGSDSDSDSSGFGMEDHTGSGGGSGDGEEEEIAEGRSSVGEGHNGNERDFSRGGSPERSGSDVDAEDAPKNNISKSCNAQARTLVQVDMQEFKELGEADGMPLFFVSEAIGPAVSQMAMMQVLALLHLFHYPLGKDHIVSSGKFEVVWDQSKGGKNGMTMEKLRMTVDKHTEADEAEAFSTIDDYPTDFHRDFTGAGNASSKKIVPFGEILMCPVVARYIDSSTGRPCCKTFWVVVVKTRRVYNITKHLCDFLRSPDKTPRDYNRGTDWQDVHQLWQVKN